LENVSEDKKVISDDSRKILNEAFQELKRKILIEVYTDGKMQNPYNKLSIDFVTELSEISDRISFKILKIGEGRSKEKKITRSPTILIDPDSYNIRYTGAPAGEEGRSFIQTIVMVSNDDGKLSKKSRKRLAELKENRNIMVFVTPACPYCPGEVIIANSTAIERPDLITAECVETSENIDLAKKYNVGTVPQTVINEKLISIGVQQEDQFIDGLITLEQRSMPETPAPGEAGDVLGEFDLIIVGAGPAGLTAGIYASRSGLHSIILDKSITGGQVSITPMVENWPGMARVAGKQLMDLMTDHAKKYAHIHENEEVLEIKVGRKIEAITRNGKYVGRALLIATGATHRKLGVPGEDKFYGKGVSYCATCDGYFYKGRSAVVIGGGNTALTDALYLDSLGAKVNIIHRRDSFRAEEHLVKSVMERKIDVLWNSTISEIKGGKEAEALVVKDVKKGKKKTISVEGIFIAIGEIPVSEVAASIGVKTDEAGFIIVDRNQRTSIPRIYAAGDVTGGVRQIVTATGTGAVAALSAFQDLAKESTSKSDN